MRFEQTAVMLRLWGKLAWALYFLTWQLRAAMDSYST